MCYNSTSSNVRIFPFLSFQNVYFNSNAKSIPHMYLPNKLFQLMNLTLKILLGDIQVTLSIRTLMISIYKYFPRPKNVKRPRNVHIRTLLH